MWKNFRLAIGLAALTAAIAAAPAQAIPIVSIEPSFQAVGVGDPVLVDIRVSNLAATDVVGGFSLTLSFNGAILQGDGYTIGSPLGTGFDFGPGGGWDGSAPLELFFVSTETAATLDANQGAAFTLSSLSFTALAPGLSALQLSDVVLSDALGEELASESRSGSVCVADQCDRVPEPLSLWLLGTGLVGFVARHRRAR